MLQVFLKKNLNSEKSMKIWWKNGDFLIPKKSTFHDVTNSQERV